MAEPSPPPLDERADAPPLQQRRYVLAVVAVMGAAVLVRVLPALSGFPLNDGGLFAVMAGELRDNGFWLPTTVSYNSADIPFAYPPLGFVLTGLVSLAPGLSLLDAMVIVPVGASILTVWAFHRFALRVVDERTALVATLLFALMPRTFHWQIMGGGITRSPGMLLAIVSLSFSHDALVSGRRDRRVAAAVLIGLTVMTHPQMGLFAGWAALLFALVAAGDDRRRRLTDLVVIGLGALAVCIPWLVALVVNGNLEAFVAAGGSSQWGIGAVARVLVRSPTNSALMDPVPILAIIGLLACLRERRDLLVWWMAVIVVTDPRVSQTMVQLPLALFAAIAVTEVIGPRLAPSKDSQRDVRRGALTTLAVYALVIGMFGGIVTPSVVRAPTQTLREGEREAMAWVAANVDGDARFAVLSDTGVSWAEDAVVEWFPALTGRVALNTPQGAEWLPGGAFGEALERHRDLRMCVGRDLACLEQWAVDHDRAPTHLYLASSVGQPTVPSPPEECCSLLRHGAQQSPQWRLIYSARDVHVFERVS